MTRTNRLPCAWASRIKRFRRGWACSSVIPCRSNRASGLNLPCFSRMNAFLSIATGALTKCWSRLGARLFFATSGAARSPSLNDLMERGDIGSGTLVFVGLPTIDALDRTDIGIAVSVTRAQSSCSSGFKVRLPRFISLTAGGQCVGRLDWHQSDKPTTITDATCSAARLITSPIINIRPLRAFDRRSGILGNHQTT